MIPCITQCLSARREVQILKIQAGSIWGWIGDIANLISAAASASAVSVSASVSVSPSQSPSLPPSPYPSLSSSPSHLRFVFISFHLISYHVITYHIISYDIMLSHLPVAPEKSRLFSRSIGTLRRGSGRFVEKLNPVTFEP